MTLAPHDPLPQGFWLETVDSTMDEARRLIAAGKIHGTAYIVAEHQTQGRGTQGRQWSSPAQKGIYLSIIHLPVASAFFETTTLYTLAAGVACVEAIQTVTGLRPDIKPINDLYVEGKKLGGILVESDLHSQGMSCLITGIGINVSQSKHALDRGEIIPTSLEAHLSPDEFKNLNTEVLIEALVGKVCFWYGYLFNNQPGVIQRTYAVLQNSR